MNTTESPRFYLDMKDEQTCHRLLSAQPARTIAVKVRDARDPALPQIPATGMMSDNRSAFLVSVQNDGHAESYAWYWWLLEELLPAPPRRGGCRVIPLAHYRSRRAARRAPAADA